MHGIERFLRNEPAAPNAGVPHPFVLSLPAGEDWGLFDAMEREGLRVGAPFELAALADDRLAELIAHRSAEAATGDRFDGWRDVTFPDGSHFEDPLGVELTVLRFIPRLHGLSGQAMDYEVVARFEPALARG